MIKTVIVLLNFPFKCRLVKEIRTSAVVQASKQASQLASAIDCVENITSFRETWASKSFLFFQDSKETCSLMFVSAIKKVYQVNIPFVKTIHMYLFH